MSPLKTGFYGGGGSGGIGPCPPCDTNVFFIDSFDVEDTLAGELGPVQTQDSFDITDDPDFGPIIFQESFDTDDAVIVGQLTSQFLDSFDLEDALNDILGPQFTDSFDTDDQPDATVTLLDSLSFSDASFINTGTITAEDSFTLSDARNEFTGTTLQFDSFSVSDAIGVLDLVVPDSFTTDDAVVDSTLNLTEFAAATQATTNIDNPGNVLQDTTNTFAESAIAATGIGGITSNDENFVLEISMSDLDIDDFLTNYSNVDVHFEWSFTTDGTALTADGGHDYDWEYSLNDGGVWNFLGSNNHLTHGTAGIGISDAKQTVSFDLTGILDTQLEFNQLRLRAIGFTRSGTGLSRISRLRFHRMWVTATINQV